MSEDVRNRTEEDLRYEAEVSERVRSSGPYRAAHQRMRERAKERQRFRISYLAFGIICGVLSSVIDPERTGVAHVNGALFVTLTATCFAWTTGSGLLGWMDWYDYDRFKPSDKRRIKGFADRRKRLRKMNRWMG